jgi:hypothetical protein
MDRNEPLAPCFIERGTLCEHIDMMRALDTVEALRFKQVVDGEPIAEGDATLVKLSADDTATMLVNGCLFLNVASFRYLTFAVLPESGCHFELHREGMTLTIEPRDEPKTGGEPPCRRAALSVADEFGSFVMGEEEDSEE